MLACTALVACLWLQPAQPAQSDPKAPAAATTVRLDFDEVPYRTVLEWLAGRLSLTLQAEVEIPGKFTYHDPREFSPEDALDLVHGVLLERGYTLVRRDSLLLCLLLAEDLHLGLAPRVDPSELDRLPKHQMVWTTFRLRTLPPEALAAQLAPTLSVRGRIVSTGIARRLSVCDRVDVLLQLRDLLATLDKVADEKPPSVRVFLLRHASALQAAEVVRELFGASPTNSAAPSNPFTRIGQELATPSMLEAFVPGLPVRQFLPESVRTPTAVRLTVDDRLNAIVVLADADVLGRVALTMEALDKPSASPVARTILRRHEVPEKDADQLAQQLKRVLANDPQVQVAGEGRTLIVRGTQEQQDRVAELIEALGSAGTVQVGVFRLRQRTAADVVRQLNRLFESTQANKKITIVADKVENLVVVRGAAAEVEQVRLLLLGMGELSGR